jgi:integration host factor subunit alpha
MSYTKADFIDTLAAEIGFTRRQSVAVAETLLEVIKQALSSGDHVLISGFGKFSVREKNERRGRNPATGGDMMLRPRKVVTFKCSGKLRTLLNAEPLPRRKAML